MSRKSEKSSVVGDIAVRMLIWLKLSYVYTGKIGKQRKCVCVCVCCTGGGGLMSELHPHLPTVGSQHRTPKNQEIAKWQHKHGIEKYRGE